MATTVVLQVEISPDDLLPPPKYVVFGPSGPTPVEAEFRPADVIRKAIFRQKRADMQKLKLLEDISAHSRDSSASTLPFIMEAPEEMSTDDDSSNASSPDSSFYMDPGSKSTTDRPTKKKKKKSKKKKKKKKKSSPSSSPVIDSGRKSAPSFSGHTRRESQGTLDARERRRVHEAKSQELCRRVCSLRVNELTPRMAMRELKIFRDEWRRCGPIPDEYYAVHSDGTVARGLPYATPERRAAASAAAKGS